MKWTPRLRRESSGGASTAVTESWRSPSAMKRMMLRWGRGSVVLADGSAASGSTAVADRGTVIDGAALLAWATMAAGAVWTRGARGWTLAAAISVVAQADRAIENRTIARTLGRILLGSLA